MSTCNKCIKQTFKKRRGNHISDDNVQCEKCIIISKIHSDGKDIKVVHNTEDIILEVKHASLLSSFIGHSVKTSNKTGNLSKEQ